jgi:hypothetical protein
MRTQFSLRRRIMVPQVTPALYGQNYPGSGGMTIPVHRPATAVISTVAYSW